MSTSDRSKALEARRSESFKQIRSYAPKLVDKLLTEYQYEEKPCFCGSVEEKEITDADRFGLPHRIVVCKKCALLRANPRLTKESYARFYNEDYRIINCPNVVGEDLAELSDNDFYFVVGQAKGQRLKKALDDFQLAKNLKVVVDYGCHLGGMGSVFVEDGVEVWGIEIDEESAEKARANGLKVVSSIDELIEKGVKADLVIMQDMIEHLLDLREEMRKVGSILKPLVGALYVWTPGLFKHDPIKLWQLAHTYQFCRATLEYVMTNCGYTPYFCDEEIASFWRYDGEKADPQEPPVEWVEYEEDSAFHRETRKLPPFRGFCKFTRKELYEHVEHNLALGHPDLSEIVGTKTGEIALVAGGPSVDGQVEELRALQKRNVPVLAIAKMYPWLAKNGIKPDYVMALDAMDDQVDGFKELQPNVTYLLSTVANSGIFDLLKNEKCYVWDSRDDVEMTQRRLRAGYKRCTVINGGSSIGVAMISMAFTLGYTFPHIFGLDCMVPSEDHTHAEGIAGTNVVPLIFEVEIEGEKILTSSSWIEFARQALQIIDAAHSTGQLEDVQFYGETLCTKLWDGEWADE